MSGIILTDIDGVVLDWEFGFHTWMQCHGHNPVEDGVDHYSMAEHYGLELDVSRSLCRTFNESAAIGFLPPLRDAQYYIKLLHEKHRYQFVAVTSLSKDPSAQKLRIRNLSKIFGPNTFVDHVFLDTGEDKDDILASLATSFPGHMWIEDKPVNAEAGAAVGFDAYLMEHGHNKHYQGPAQLVKNWEEIYNLINKG